MTEPIDLSAVRDARNGPDAEHIRRDDFGRNLYHYSLSYEMDGKIWTIDIWAYSMDDAARRVDAMKNNLIMKGQIYGSVSA